MQYEGVFSYQPQNDSLGEIEEVVPFEYGGDYDSLARDEDEDEHVEGVRGPVRRGAATHILPVPAAIVSTEHALRPGHHAVEDGLLRH